jgi:hypothetical protein
MKRKEKSMKKWHVWVGNTNPWKAGSFSSKSAANAFAAKFAAKGWKTNVFFVK